MGAAVQASESVAATERGPEPVSGDATHAAIDRLSWLPCTLSLDLPVVHFTVGDLLRLAPEDILETGCHHTGDLPLRVNGQLIGWTEFEVVGDFLAARITDLA